MDRKILGEQLRQEIQENHQEWMALQTRVEAFVLQTEADCQALKAENAALKLQNAHLQETVEQLQASLKQALACPEELQEEQDLPSLENEEGAFLQDELVEEKTDNGVSSSSHQQAIHKDGRLIYDLRKAIGLNDRFRFKHDLFQNQEDLMWKTIDALNELDSLSAAMAYLQAHFSWNEEDATVIYFKEILGRKFYRS